MEFTFLWRLENYSYCWKKTGEFLSSPMFPLLDGKNCQLLLYPRGIDEIGNEYISLLVVTNFGDDRIFSTKCEVSLLTDSGISFSNSVSTLIEQKLLWFFNHKFIQRDEILLGRNNNYLLQDTLTVRCKIWNDDYEICDFIETTARSRIQIEKASFLHILKRFSTLQPNIKQPINICSQSNKEISISCNLYFLEDIFREEQMVVEIIPTKQILLKMKFFILDVSGNLTKCGMIDNRYDTVIKSSYIFRLSFTKQGLLKKKSDYLPDDKLSLFCECTYSSELEFKEIEEVSENKPCMVRNNINKSEKPISLLSSISEDMKDLYIKQCLTDFKIKTRTKTFEAHKSVLCARSPVFKALLTKDMQEKHNNCIHVDDLADDIIEQLLLFLYSDTLGNLQWNTALQLYYAADKYQVDKLKKICSSFLTSNLIANNAGELLILADTHSDADLKKSVEDFIFEHEEQVLGTKEFEKLLETHPHLAIETMLLKYKRKMN